MEVLRKYSGKQSCRKQFGKTLGKNSGIKINFLDKFTKIGDIE